MRMGCEMHRKKLPSFEQHMGCVVDFSKLMRAGAVETNTVQARERAEQGTEYLNQASESQRGYTKAILCFLAIVLVIGGGLTAFFLLKKK